MSNGIRQGWPSTIKINWLLASGFDGKLLILIMAFMADWKSDIRTHWLNKIQFLYELLSSHMSAQILQVFQHCSSVCKLY